MVGQGTTFIGVAFIRAPGRLRRAYVYSALDADQKLLAICHSDMDELLTYLGGQKSVFVALDTPRAPNKGILRGLDSGQSSFSFADSPQKINARLCEHQLNQQGFKIEHTPGRFEDCPRWMRQSFDLYRQLESLGFGAYPNPKGSHHSLETRAEAVFWRLLHNNHPLPCSLEGRLQRQLILYDQKLPVSDAMDFFLEVTRHKLLQGVLPDQDILSIDELNALAAAYVAWLAGQHPDQVELIGDAEEGQIILPILKFAPTL